MRHPSVFPTVTNESAYAIRENEDCSLVNCEPANVSQLLWGPILEGRTEGNKLPGCHSYPTYSCRTRQCGG